MKWEINLGRCKLFHLKIHPLYQNISNLGTELYLPTTLNDAVLVLMHIILQRFWQLLCCRDWSTLVQWSSTHSIIPVINFLISSTTQHECIMQLSNIYWSVSGHYCFSLYLTCKSLKLIGVRQTFMGTAKLYWTEVHWLMTQRPLNIHTIAISIMRRVVTPVTMVQEGVGTSGGDQVRCLRYRDHVRLSHWSHIKHAQHNPQ